MGRRRGKPPGLEQRGGKLPQHGLGGKRVSRQPEHRSVVHAPEHHRLTGLDCHTMEDKIAQRPDHGLGEVTGACRRSGRDEDKVILKNGPFHGVFDDIGIVRCNRVAGTRCTHLGEEDLCHDRVALNNLPRPRADPRRHKFASRGDDPDFYRKDFDGRDPVGDQRTDVEGPDEVPPREDEFVLLDVFSRRPDMLPGHRGPAYLDASVVFPDVLNHDDGVKLGRHDVAGVYA